MQTSSKANPAVRSTQGSQVGRRDWMSKRLIGRLLRFGHDYVAHGSGWLAPTSGDA